MINLYSKYSPRLLFIVSTIVIIFLTIFYIVLVNIKPIKKQSPQAPIAPTPILGFPVYTSPKVLESPSSEEQQNLQIEADKNTAEWFDALYKSYPWFDKLPLMGDLYFVYFDVNRTIFVAKIYSKDPTVVENAKTKILSELSAIGIDTKQYTIEWKTITPAP